MRDGGGRQDTRAVDSVICSGSVLNLPIIGARGSRQIINGGGGLGKAFRNTRIPGDG